MVLLSRGRRALATYLALLLCYVSFNLFLVQTLYIHHDEGWYLYASQLVYRGKLPYLDFAYFQSPLLPYVYGLFQYLTGPSVLVGRLTSLTLNLGLATFTILIARRLGGNLAAIIALLCLGTSADFMRVGSYANNVILSAFLAVLGTWWLLRDWAKQSTQVMATGCWSLAVLARLSLGLGLALVVGFILWHHRYRLIDAWTAVVTPNLILLAGLGSFAIMNFDRAHFNLFAAQLGRRHQVDWVVNPTSGVSRLELALGSFLFYTSALLIISLLGSVLLWNTFGSSLQRLNNTQHSRRLVVLIALLIPVVYLPNILPGDLYPTYLASPYAFACILAGWLVAKINQEKRLPRQALVGVAGLAIALAALISVIYLSIIISWQNPGLQQLQTLSDYVKSITTPSDRLFTFETALAANTGRPVTPGTAMSYFSYFPKFSTDQATRYQVVNEDLLSDQLTRREAELVLLTDFDVHLIRNPANSSRTEPVALTQAQLFTLFPELKGGYYLAKTTANYSEWNNHLYIFRLNKED
jgi:4-amino-4-deoxy-L-arabinose transferase-like glycosyltransferase